MEFYLVIFPDKNCICRDKCKNTAYLERGMPYSCKTVL